MESALDSLFSKGTAQNLFIVRNDDESVSGSNTVEKQHAIVRAIVSLGAARGVPVKEVMEWETSAAVAKRFDAEDEKERKQREEEEKKDNNNSDQKNNTNQSAAFGSSGIEHQVVTSSSSLTAKNKKDPIAIAWGQLCKRKLWILCPFGSCSDEKLLRSAAVEILCARTYECHVDFRVILLCNRREFDRLPRVARVLSGLQSGHHRYIVFPRGSVAVPITAGEQCSTAVPAHLAPRPEIVDEPIEEYLDYNSIELAAEAPELANYQEQVFNSDPTIRVVQYSMKRFGPRGDLFIRIMRDALKFNLTVHTLGLTSSKGGDVIARCLASILHTTRKLRHLVLTDCSLTDAGIVELAAALRKNDAVWTLNISKNPQITDVGIIALASIFAPGTKSRLEGLDISLNNAIYDTPKQWSRNALIALWEMLPRHPFLKYVSIAGCSLGSHHIVDLCDRWLGRYRRVSYEEWMQENDPDVDYHTVALRRKQQKAKRLKLQREQLKMEAALKKAAEEAEKAKQNGGKHKPSTTSSNAGDATGDVAGDNKEAAAAADAAQNVSSDVNADFAAAAEELEMLEDEFLEPWEREKMAEEKAAELERMRLENENKLFESSLVSLNLSKNTIGDAAIGLLMESLPIGLKRLNLEHVSMGASGFRAIAYALSTLKLQLEELNVSHNNAMLLTRRLLMDADGGDDYVTEVELIKRREERIAQQKQDEEDEHFYALMGETEKIDKKRKERMLMMSVSYQATHGSEDETSPARYHEDRKLPQLSAWGNPLIFYPPALEDSDWARFYVPPPKTRERGLRDFSSKIGEGDGTDKSTEKAERSNDGVEASSAAKEGEKEEAFSKQQTARPSVRNSIPLNTKALYTSLVSPTMVAVLQADAIKQSVEVDGWSFPLGEGADSGGGEGGGGDVVNNATEEAAVENSGDAAAANNSERTSSAVPFHQQDDHGRFVKSTSTVPPRHSSILALMKALDDNFQLHTLNLSAVHIGDEALRELCDLIIHCRCGVRALDVSYNGNLSEESSYKVKELLVASGTAQQQRDREANAAEMVVPSAPSSPTAAAAAAAAIAAGNNSREAIEKSDADAYNTNTTLDEDDTAAGAKPHHPLHMYNNDEAARAVTPPVFALKPPRAPPHNGNGNGNASPAEEALPAPAATSEASHANSAAAIEGILRPASGQFGASTSLPAVSKRVTTPLVVESISAPASRSGGRAGRLGGSGGGGGGNSPLNAPASANASRPNTSASSANNFDDTASSLHSTVASGNSGTSASTSLFGTTLSTISSFFQDVEGNVIDTDIGVLMSLNLAGTSLAIGERALLALYDNTGLRTLDLSGLGITDGMLQPLGDSCDASLRHQTQSKAGEAGVVSSSPASDLFYNGPPKKSITGRWSRGSYDSALYEDVDPLTGAVTPKLRLVHQPQNFYNPELSLTVLRLSGNKSIWRQGIKHLANFIRHSSTLQELYLDDNWYYFQNDLGGMTSLSQTKREGLFFFEPLLEALSGNMYSCELLKTFSSAASVLGKNRFNQSGSAANMTMDRSGSGHINTSVSNGKGQDQSLPVPGLEGGWNRCDVVRSQNNTWGAVAQRRAMANSAMNSTHNHNHGAGAAEEEGNGITKSSSYYLAGSPASALKSQQKMNSTAASGVHAVVVAGDGGGGGGGATDAPPYRTNHRAPSLRLLNLAKNDIHPIVMLELVKALRGNENLLQVILIQNPMIAVGANAEVDDAVIKGDEGWDRLGGEGSSVPSRYVRDE